MTSSESPPARQPGRTFSIATGRLHPGYCGRTEDAIFTGRENFNSSDDNAEGASSPTVPARSAIRSYIGANSGPVHAA